MKNDNVKIKIMVTAVIVMLLFSVFSTVNAQTGEYVVLAPLPGVGENANRTATLQTYLPAIFNLALGMAAVLAFVMITWGGILYATTDAISEKSQGKEYITNALWGLLLVIGAWVILFTINPGILSFNLGLPRPQITAGTPTAVVGRLMTPEELAEDQRVRNALVGIAVNSPPCAQGQTSGCTNLNGLPQNAIDGLKSLKIACRACTIVITGGTEGGHSAHGAGAPVVDLRPTADLNAFLGVSNPVEGNKVISRPGGKVNGPNAVYVYETLGGNAGGTSTGAHWHVVFQ